MIEYLVAVIAGFALGVFIEKRESKISKDFISKALTVCLFLLIFFLGYDIGSSLNVEEMSRVGKLSVVFAITTMFFSYAISKVLLRYV
ncbi:hypothetical protein Asulf_01648 [Archaeoglobus sulfaticallidus PM70-1]|uniref:DUF340 domain-containing protein n=1 Tax=Archaeoglobus sulfaticallidus PM70-1 TaxID=387631 RepID=N0BH53_9EURY|nr:LysO family transporter [Archaeoglobus sulfaticallidus]AGK61622.1 hypothetical protein Asulf_01648 [Archaeoglobus sulfaticallidus PM70-1]